jgi:hypothetical protein
MNSAARMRQIWAEQASSWGYKLFIVTKWALLLVIAVSTALVGFAQSMLVASLYRARSNFIINIVVRA